MAQAVFNKILGKKDKGFQIFNIPDKKYHHDSKKLNKMDKKQLIDEIQNMEKYISTISHKLQQGKKEYEKINDKFEECSEKLKVVNQKMAMISNQHEQLQVKFINLQNSLQFMTRQKQSMFKAQLQFIESKQLIKDKINDLTSVLKVYREQVTLTDKIAYQNKQLKIKYSKLEEDFFNLSEKIGQSKNKNQNQGGAMQTNHSNTFEQVQQEDKNKYKLMLQTKQQMIVLLNKKINQHKQKKNQLQQTINQLYHEIHTKEIQNKQKQQQTNRYVNQCTQYRKKLNNMKQICDNTKNILEVNKQQLRRKIQEIQKLNNQLIQVRNQLKLNKQQKRILISKSQHLAQNQTHSQEVQLEISRLRSELEGKNKEIQSLNRNISNLQQQKLQYLNKISSLKAIQKQNGLLRQNVAEQNRKNEQLCKKIENMQENYQIKLKKLEFNANQQRIKAQGLKRSLTNLQVKDQQNRKQLDEMYQKKMSQDNKYAKMQSKLKEYKQIIQYLRKEKVELEKTFQIKIRNMEQIVHEVEDEERNSPSQLSERNQSNIQQQIEGSQAIIRKMESKIVDLQQQIMFLKEQNKNLHSQKGELQESNMQLQKSFKVMNQKRQQVMKQIKKLSSNSIGYISSDRQYRQELTSSNGNRQRKIAEKALKGFDILSKQLTTVYKQFINLHIGDISRKQIKQLQGNINTLVGKCQDMKDIFNGYL